MKKYGLMIPVFIFTVTLTAGLVQARQVRVVVDRLEFAASYRCVHVWEDGLKKAICRIAGSPDKDFITILLLCDQYPLDAWLDEVNQEIQLLNTYGEVHA